MSSTPKRVLVVSYRTATHPRLLREIRERAARGAYHFTLLVPRDPVDDPDTESPERALELGLPLFEDAAGGPVEGMLGDPDPFVAVRDALGEHQFDEVIVSTLPKRVSRWLRRDLPRRVEQLGVPLTVVTVPQERRPLWPREGVRPHRGD